METLLSQGVAAMSWNRRVRQQAVLTAALCLAGCTPAGPPGQAPGATAQGALTAEEQRAVDLAQAFLAKAKADWGAPAQVHRATGEHHPGLAGASVYNVIYPTPNDELRLLGDRAVVVDVKTGQVEFIPRE
jgi:hypothetical protein